MQRELHSWWSPRLNREMEIAAYGHYGFAVLLFPTAAADYLEYERFHMIDAISEAINGGRCKVFSINSINSESWLNSNMAGRDKVIRHQQYNSYIAEEVVPFIHNHCGGTVPIITSGASLGAFHAANTVFRRPDLFDGTIAMSGIYDLKSYSKGYWDEDCFYNSPTDYLPGLPEGDDLDLLRQKKHIHFVSGSGNYEAPDASRLIGKICELKGIPNEVDIWGADMPHDWPTWRAMLPFYLNNKLGDL